MDAEVFIGVDVAASRGCAFAVVDDNGVLIDSGVLQNDQLIAEVEDLLAQYPRAAFGIDAPRQPLRVPRPWYWRNNQWRAKRASDRGYGRHCEVVIKAWGIANPQWTRFAGDAPPWMQVGFSLFAELTDRDNVFETFPSASYATLRGVHDVRVDIDFDAFSMMPKDMLDAVMCAATAREYVGGRGLAVGGGDGLGQIVLPRVPQRTGPQAVLSWPHLSDS